MYTASTSLRFHVSNNTFILSELERARKRLIDLTMRNRLLNYRQTSVRTIKAVDELAPEVYHLLVIEGRTMEFLPRSVSTSSALQGHNSDQSVIEDTGLSEAEQHTLWTLPLPDLQPSDHHTDKYLQTTLEKILNDICLDFFSFAKYIMFRDLEPKSWPAEFSPINNPLVKAILDPSSSEPGIPGFNEEEIDEKLGSKDIYHVMDADPSQIAVIEDIKAGRNLVVEGPPGTGKSQTITNAIAELIAAGKTVLFVSEKMAALRVVKDRLDKVELGTFCLELHSNKTKKSEVLLELRRTADAPEGQRRLFDDIRYFFYITTLRDRTAGEVVALANGRCDQENVIEQLKNGVNAMKLPLRDLLSNWAYMVIASLAWNFKAWFDMLMPNVVRGEQVLKMEFRRFLNTLIMIPCQIVKTGRKIIYRMLGYNDWLKDFFETWERIRRISWA